MSVWVERCRHCGPSRRRTTRAGKAAGDGRAKRLQVRISDAGDPTVIEVHDDGNGFTDIRPGLGSRLFDKTTGGNWSLTPGSPLGGCVFRAEVTRT